MEKHALHNVHKGKFRNRTTCCVLPNEEDRPSNLKRIKASLVKCHNVQGFPGFTSQPQVLGPAQVRKKSQTKSSKEVHCLSYINKHQLRVLFVGQGPSIVWLIFGILSGGGVGKKKTTQKEATCEANILPSTQIKHTTAQNNRNRLYIMFSDTTTTPRSRKYYSTKP